MLRDLRAFALLVWHDWLATMSGIASVLLAAAGAAFPNLPAWAFWVAAMACLFVAMFRAWRREHHEKEALLGARVGGDLAAARRARVAAIISSLGPAELAALRYLLRIAPVSTVGLQGYLGRGGLPHPDLARLEAVGLIWRDGSGGWSLVPECVASLRELLGWWGIARSG